MSLNAESLRDGCQWLARELSRLEQLNRPLSFDNFFNWSDDARFIETIFSQYRQYIMALGILDKESGHCNKELLNYMEDALSRHANTVIPGTYGVVDNAYLLVINVLFAISREADEF